MEAIESLLRVLAVMLTTGLGPAPAVADPAASLRMPILSESTTAAEPGELEGVVRWQQTGDGSIDPTTEEPLDNGAANAGDEEPLDAPTGAGGDDDPEPLDNGAGATTPPSDLPADNPPASDPPTTTATTTSTSPAATKPVLPEDFGRGETVVLNPPAGVTVQAPTDCKQLLEHGRAVIGIGCGDDDGPWWLSEVGNLAPAKSVPEVKRESPVTAPTGSSQAVIVQAGQSEPEADDGVVIGHSRVSVGDQTVRVPNVRTERHITIDRSGGRTYATDRDGRGNTATTNRGNRSPNSPPLTSAQETKRGNSANDKREESQKRNVCSRMKQKARAGAGKQELSKLRQKCQKFRKAQAADR